MNDLPENAISYLNVLKLHPSLLVSGTASGAIKAIEELRDENERMREALNRIAAWDDGPEVTGHFDEPGSAHVARKALAG